MRRLTALAIVGALSTVVACKPKEAAPAPQTASSPATAAATSAPAAPAVGKGDKAPDFSLQGSDGKTHALADHLGKEVVVVAWFPKAFTGG